MEAHANDLTSMALVTTVAVLCGLLFTRLRQPAIVGYILAGVVLGPTGFRLVQNSENVTSLAELGVLMLLFLIGMELSLRHFKSVLAVASCCAVLQIGFSLGITALLARLFDWPWQQAVVLGFVFALSSTAVAIKMLEDIKELRSPVGRITVGVLIAQDLAIVPMLVLIHGMGGEGTLGYDVIAKLVLASAFLVALIWFLSRRQKIVLPTRRWMKGKLDLIPLAALAFCFSAATVSGLLGLSAAYGAFLAGLVIGQSTDRAVTIRATRPIQSVLLVVFFLSIGLLIDWRYIWENLGLVLTLLASAVFVKTAINVGALRLLREPWERAFPAGVIMGQIGEFSFVLAAAGVGVGAIDKEGYRLAISVIALSLLISPVWLITARRFMAIASDGVTNIQSALAETFKEEVTAYATAVSLVRRGAAKLRKGDDKTLQKSLPAPTPLLEAEPPLEPLAEAEVVVSEEPEATAEPPLEPLADGEPEGSGEAGTEDEEKPAAKHRDDVTEPAE